MSAVSEARSVLALAMRDARQIRQHNAVIMSAIKAAAKQSRLDRAAVVRADRAAAKQTRLDMATAMRADKAATRRINKATAKQDRQRRAISKRAAKQVRFDAATAMRVDKATTSKQARLDRAVAKQARLDATAAKRARPAPHRPTFAEIAQQVNESCVAQASIDARGPDPDVLAYVMHMGATRRVQRMRALSAVAACTPVALTRADVVRRAIAAGTPALRAHVGAVGVAFERFLITRR